jgi:predicted translin family RNA/ssDNA-binding protein
MSTGPLSSADFAAIQKSMVEEDEKRESLIKRSRDVLKHSKQAIYALQRGDAASADALIQSAKAAALPLLALLAASPQLRFGAMSAALEEWAEAFIFSVFLKEKRIPTMAELEIGAWRRLFRAGRAGCGRATTHTHTHSLTFHTRTLLRYRAVNIDEYLGGVMDFCGEINRFAVLAATRRDVAAVASAREVVDALLAQLMLFEFRNGSLRRKYDGVKYTLQKLEQVAYDLSLSSVGYLPKGGAREVGPAPAEGGGGGGDDGDGGAEGGAEGGEQRKRGRGE